MGPIIAPYSAAVDIAQKREKRFLDDLAAQRTRQQSLAERLAPTVADLMTAQAYNPEDPSIGRALEGLGPYIGETYGISQGQTPAESRQFVPSVPRESPYERYMQSAGQDVAALRALRATNPEALKRADDLLAQRLQTEQQEAQKIYYKLFEDVNKANQREALLAQAKNLIAKTPTGPKTGGAVADLAGAWKPEYGKFFQSFFQDPTQTQLRSTLEQLYNSIAEDHASLLGGAAAGENPAVLTDSGEQMLAKLRAIQQVNDFNLLSHAILQRWQEAFPDKTPSFAVMQRVREEAKKEVLKKYELK